MKIGMYSSDEIYDELANGFLHHSMVDAMYFEIKKLQEEKEHYKHLYSEVKKQKDDVVEYIKKYLHEHIIDDLPDEESNFETENGIPIPNAKEILLRMLGEIE